MTHSGTSTSPHDFGAVGDGTTLDTGALQQAINFCAAQGGGLIVLRRGHTYLSGSLELKPRVSIHVEEGSTLLASDNYDDYASEHTVDRVTNGVVTETVLPKRAFLVGYRAHGCQITGPGKISGNGRGFIDMPGDHIHTMRIPEGGRDQYFERPFTIFLIDCDDVVIRDIHLDDPAFWALRLTGCDNSSITGITLTSDMKIPNADGIDIDRCENVDITDCQITTADDCISIKSCAGTTVYGDTRDIRIRDCVLETLSGAITIGTESVGLIEDVVVDNCDVRNSHRGFAVRAREGGLMRNIVFRNSRVHTVAYSPDWWGHGEALHVTAFRWSEPESLGDGNPERTLYGEVENVVFENLSVDSGAGMLCWAQHRGLISGVTFSQCDITIRPVSSWPARIDLRPNDIHPMINRPPNAFEIVNSDGVTVTDVEVNWKGAAPATPGEALFVENSDVEVSALSVSALS